MSAIAEAEERGKPLTVEEAVKRIAKRLKELGRKYGKPGEAFYLGKMRKAAAEAEQLFTAAALDVTAKVDAKAKNNSAAPQDGVRRYSKATLGDGTEYWVIETDKDIFKGIKNIKDMQTAAYNFLIDNRNNNTVIHTVDGKSMRFIRLSAEEFTQSKQSRNLYNNNLEMFKQKMRLIPSLEDLTINANVYWTSPDHKNHKPFKERGFENYRGKVGIDNVIFNYVVIAGKTKTGDVFYDINIEVATYLPHAKSASDILEATSNNPTIPQLDSGVKIYNMQNSKKDSWLRIQLLPALRV